MRYEATVLIATTSLVAFTYLVVVEYAGAEPFRVFLAQDALVFIGVPGALVAAWLLLSGAGVLMGLQRRIPRWLAVVLCALAGIAIWFCFRTATDYADAIAHPFHHSCPS